MLNVKGTTLLKGTTTQGCFRKVNAFYSDCIAFVTGMAMQRYFNLKDMGGKRWKCVGVTLKILSITSIGVFIPLANVLIYMLPHKVHVLGYQTKWSFSRDSNVMNITLLPCYNILNIYTQLTGFVISYSDQTGGLLLIILYYRIHPLICSAVSV